MAKRLDPKYLLIGQILRPHGVKGEVRIRVLTDYPERIRHLEHVYLAPEPDTMSPEKHRVKAARLHQQYALLTLVGVDNRDRAELLRGLFVLVDIEDAVPLEEDEVYLFQLIGMNVVTESGDLIGVLVDVLETGANDVYVVDSPQHGEVLIPAIDDTILLTDTEQNRITVRLPEGLIRG